MDEILNIIETQQKTEQPVVETVPPKPAKTKQLPRKLEAKDHYIRRYNETRPESEHIKLSDINMRTVRQEANAEAKAGNPAKLRLVEQADKDLEVSNKEREQLLANHNAPAATKRNRTDEHFSSEMKKIIKICVEGVENQRDWLSKLAGELKKQID